ncbi:MAG: emrB [Alphaproteobacteria bacterium]|jgi:DHA2 family multidrug resistance protein|nr:emrB [Alphaproteobacteria bacterium]
MVGAEAPARHPLIVTAAVMVPAIMYALDTTIANVALPHMQGSLSATHDQIAWVLTSYIVASAIMTAPTAWLAARFGRRNYFAIAVAGFTITSGLCGAAQDLGQIVLFRILQGVFGASLIPLSQSVLLDTYPPEKHGSAMALWGIGVMIGPILGPTLGGYLTELYGWRYVFYINVPIGVLSVAVIMLVIPDNAEHRRFRFDLLGFALLSLAVGSFQLMLDRGQGEDWFQSLEIKLEALVAATALAMFIVHSLTARQPFVSLALFRDHNFVLGVTLMFLVGLLLYSLLALLPPFLQQLKDYPVMAVGEVIAPRGVGTMLAMLIVGRLLNRFDLRIFIISGLLVAAYATWDMTTFTLDVSLRRLLVNGFIQGFGLGLLFVPLTTVTFSTLQAALRPEGTGIYALLRNLGSSIGISMVVAVLTHQTDAGVIELSWRANFDAEQVAEALAAGGATVDRLQAVSLIHAELVRQAGMIAYLDDFTLLFWLTLLPIPLVLLIRRRRFDAT